MNYFGSILAQQQSPIELLIFLLLVMLVFSLIAAIIYVALLWLLHTLSRSELALSQVVFPSADQFWDSFGHYLLLGATSAVLSFTLLVKSDMVEQLLSSPLSAQDVSEFSKTLEYGLSDAMSDNLLGASLQDVVKPILVAGKRAEAEHFISGKIASLPLEKSLNTTILVLICTLISLLYVYWLARRRIVAIGKDHQERIDLGSGVRGLLTLALCIGLLLASGLPLLAQDRESLARSALAQIEYDVQNNLGVMNELVTQELSRHLAHKEWLYCPDCMTSSESFEQVVNLGSAELAQIRLQMQTAAQQLADDHSNDRTTLEQQIQLLKSTRTDIERQFDEFIGQKALELQQLAESFEGQLTDYTREKDLVLQQLADSHVALINEHHQSMLSKLGEYEQQLDDLAGVQRDQRQLIAKTNALERDVRNYQSALSRTNTTIANIQTRHQRDINALQQTISNYHSRLVVQ